VANTLDLGKLLVKCQAILLNLALTKIESMPINFGIVTISNDSKVINEYIEPIKIHKHVMKKSLYIIFERYVLIVESYIRA
jgi:hypothetical protein